MKKKGIKIGELLFFLAIFFVGSFIFLTMSYIDNQVNSQTGYDVLNSLLKGRFLEYFHSFDWPYGFTIYIIYAVWSIPIWIFFQILDLSQPINDYICVLLWYKLLLVVFATWSVYLVCKIAEKISQVKKRYIIMQYISSSVFVFIILAVSQCDIIGLCFVLLGLYYCMQGNYVKYVVCFAIAITMKYFALLAFIPLVLYKERRIIRILISLASGLSLTVLTKIVLRFSETASVQKVSDEYFVNQLVSQFDSYSIMSGRPIGMMAATFLAICVLAFAMRNKDDELCNKRIIWLVLAGYMCFVLFFPIYPYWNVLTVPFFILLMNLDKTKLRVNMVLEIGFFTSVIIINAYIQKFVFMGFHAYNFLLFRDSVKFNYNNLLVYFCDNILGFDLGTIISHLTGIQYACAIIFLIYNFPRGTSDTVELDAGEKQDIKILLWIKVGIIYAFTIVAFLAWKHACNEAEYHGEAKVSFAKEQYKAEHCDIVGDLQYIGEDIWMSEELEIKINAKEVDCDMLVSTYGYTVDGKTDVEVYVNEQYVGTLQKQDASENATVRYLQVPQQYFEDNQVNTIRFVAVPQPITHRGTEVMISLYMTYIDLSYVTN